MILLIDFMEVTFMKKMLKAMLCSVVAINLAAGYIMPVSDFPTAYAVNEETSYGDLDGDNIVSSADALCILQNITGIKEFSDEQKACGDVDRDGRITSSDALMIMNYVVGNISEPSPVQRIDDYTSDFASVTYSFDITYYKTPLNNNHDYKANPYLRPVYKCENSDELNSFKTDFAEIIKFGKHGELFENITQSFDDEYFENNTAVFVYVLSPSGSFYYGVDNIRIINNNLLVIDIERNNPECYTDDMDAWFAVITIPKSITENIENFDAC